MTDKLLRGLTRSGQWGESRADTLIESSLDHTEDFLRELANLSDKQQEAALRGLTVRIRNIRREKRKQA